MENKDTGNGNAGTSSRMDETRRVAAEKLEEGKELAGDLMERLATAVRRSPGMALVCAIGAGFLIGRMVRR